MRRFLGWCCLAIGAALVAVAVTAPGPWVGLPVGLLALGVAAWALNVYGDPTA